MDDQSSRSMTKTSKWRSLLRDISCTSFFLASNLIRLIPSVSAFPTDTPTSTTSSATAAASATSPDSSSRDGSFQILADGTQDIAALVGIFATDSVERYAIDYSRGFLSTAVSNLSLLGLLGYVRLLVKLSLGAERCQKAGLDLKALRPMFGIQDEDYVPADKVHEVYYVERARKDGRVQWRVEKEIRHTEETCPLVAERNSNGPWEIASQTLDFKYMKNFVRFSDLVPPLLSKWIDAKYLVMLLLSSLCSSLCIAVTCFSIAPFAGAFEHQSWTYYYATFGLFGSVLIPNMMWSWVHMQEHHPLQLSGWVIPPLSFGIDYPPFRSLDMESAFAVSQNGSGFTIHDVKIVGGRLRKVLQTLSCLASLSILLG